MPTSIRSTHDLREEALHEAAILLLRENGHKVEEPVTGNLIVDGKVIYYHEWQLIIHGKTSDILESVREKKEPRIWP